MDIKPRHKMAKQYQPTRLEVAKTVALVALVVAVAAFVAGIGYANNQRASLERAVDQAKVEAQAQLSK